MRGLAVLVLLFLSASTTGSLGDELGSEGAGAGLTAARADVCAPVCTVPSTRFGYATPATVVVSGSTVQWTSEDGEYHSSTSASACFDTRFEPGDVGAVTFTIHEGALYASSDGKPAARCDHAVSAGGGAFTIDYSCIFHPTFQKGAIVVLPDPGAST